MFLATVLTNRPEELQVDQWALRGGEPFRAHVRSIVYVTEKFWLETEVLVVDVNELEFLTELYGYREGMTLLAGVGWAEDLLMAEFYRTGYCNAFARVDRFDPRSALMAILDRIRRGEFRSVEAALVRG
jgi:hypothetical protein